MLKPPPPRLISAPAAGGEEFGGYLPTSNISQAAEFCQQLISIAHSVNVKQAKHLSVSIGMALQTPNEPLDKVMNAHLIHF